MRRPPKPRSWADHSSEMCEDQEWAEEAERARWEMAAFDRLNENLRRAVQDTGYPSAEALRHERRLGAVLAIETIWQDYRDAMRQAYR